MIRLPHAIPYQGSKRKLAPLIRPYIPEGIDRFYEPFAGSAAMTIYAAHHQLAGQYVIADCLESIVDLWEHIVVSPETASVQYREVWSGFSEENLDYFNEVRARYNEDGDPIDLLYVICRCVKNSVRFGASGNFSQSADKRRKGMHPDKMEAAILGVSSLLKGRCEFRVGDWLETTRDATPGDFIYMDPPYLGTTVGRDKRYCQQLQQDRLIDGVSGLNSRGLRFALSYDGMTGNKVYGPPLPDGLGLFRVLLHAGRSSQATLQGKSEETIESLYLSPTLEAPDEESGEKPELGQQELFT